MDLYLPNELKKMRIWCNSRKFKLDLCMWRVWWLKTAWLN